jgi:cytochrome P450
MQPTNPIDAVTHRDPYPYYARLLAGPPLQYDPELRLWVASRAITVSEVFANQACRVRPAAEPVPSALNGLPAGAIFSDLVRMTDGSRHDQPKLSLKRALASIPAADIEVRSRRAAALALPATMEPEALAAWTFDTPVAVIADLLGFQADERSAIAVWIREFVACLSSLSTPEQQSTASRAAVLLQCRMQSMLQSSEPQSDSLISRVRFESARVGWVDTASIVANLIGLLSQAYEATAGLIGNSLVALASHPRLLAEVLARADGWHLLVHETSRYDSPVQNTRRFVVEPTTIGGVDLAPGAVVLLVLAAANRDPSANPEPEKFLLDRRGRCVFSFSRGAHACPGEALARGIAAAALSELCDTKSVAALARLACTWKPSTNGRIPIFAPRAPKDAFSPDPPNHGST